MESSWTCWSTWPPVYSVYRIAIARTYLSQFGIPVIQKPRDKIKFWSKPRNIQSKCSQTHQGLEIRSLKKDVIPIPIWNSSSKPGANNQNLTETQESSIQMLPNPQSLKSKLKGRHIYPNLQFQFQTQMPKIKFWPKPRNLQSKCFGTDKKFKIKRGRKNGRRLDYLYSSYLSKSLPPPCLLEAMTIKAIRDRSRAIPLNPNEPLLNKSSLFHRLTIPVTSPLIPGVVGV